jgi:hypothetical protein
MNTGIGVWLQSPEGVAVLLACAADIERVAYRNSLNLGRIFGEDFVGDSQEWRRIIASELAMYLLQHQTAVAGDIADDVAAGATSALTAKITTRFQSHLLDKQRTEAVSPFHMYLRHLRKVISQTDDVRYLPTDKGSFYAYSDRDDLICLPYVWWDLPFEDWPSPSVPISEIDDQSGMRTLSRHYWNEAVCRQDQEYFQPLRELTRFVFAKYPYVFQRQDVSAAGHDRDAGPDAMEAWQPTQLPGDPLGPPRRHSAFPDYDVIETELLRLASICSVGLDDRQAEILWRAAAGETLAGIARQLGEKGPSNIHYQLKKAQGHIRKFWSLWGNAQLPGFAEEDEEEQFIFVGKIVHLCKERTGGREAI